MNEPDVRLWKRLLSKTALGAVGTNACWLWTGAMHFKGYALLRPHARVHRVYYELLVSPIAPGLTIDHLCRVRHCVNPAHMEPVTNKENVLRGIGITAQNARKTHCPRAHEYTPENTAPMPRGRECRACRKIYRATENERRRERRAMARQALAVAP